MSAAVKPRDLQFTKEDVADLLQFLFLDMKKDAIVQNYLEFWISLCDPRTKLTQEILQKKARKLDIDAEKRILDAVERKWPTVFEGDFAVAVLNPAAKNISEYDYSGPRSRTRRRKGISMKTAAKGIISALTLAGSATATTNIERQNACLEHYLKADGAHLGVAATLSRFAAYVPQIVLGPKSSTVKYPCVKRDESSYFRHSIGFCESTPVDISTSAWQGTSEVLRKANAGKPVTKAELLGMTQKEFPTRPLSEEAEKHLQEYEKCVAQLADGPSDFVYPSTLNAGDKFTLTRPPQNGADYDTYVFFHNLNAGQSVLPLSYHLYSNIVFGNTCEAPARPGVQILGEDEYGDEWEEDEDNEPPPAAAPGAASESDTEHIILTRGPEPNVRRAAGSLELAVFTLGTAFLRFSNLPLVISETAVIELYERIGKLLYERIGNLVFLLVPLVLGGTAATYYTARSMFIPLQYVGSTFLYIGKWGVYCMIWPFTTSVRLIKKGAELAVVFSKSVRAKKAAIKKGRTVGTTGGAAKRAGVRTTASRNGGASKSAFSTEESEMQRTDEIKLNLLLLSRQRKTLTEKKNESDQLERIDNEILDLWEELQKLEK